MMKNTARRMLLLMLGILLLGGTVSTAAAQETATATDLQISREPGERLDDDTLLSYYDRSLFVGDSIMEDFRKYRKMMLQQDPAFLPNLTIAAVANMTLYAVSCDYLHGSVQYYYMDGPKTMYEIAAYDRPKKIVILLGMNDVVGIKPDKALGWVETIHDTMYWYARDAEICFLSHTPVSINYCIQRERPEYQRQLDEYNRRLREKCEELGMRYIEVAEKLKGEDGYLNEAYSSDHFCHLNTEGLAVLTEGLCDYAQEQYEAGLWFPEEPD